MNYDELAKNLQEYKAVKRDLAIMEIIRYFDDHYDEFEEFYLEIECDLYIPGAIHWHEMCWINDEFCGCSTLEILEQLDDEFSAYDDYFYHDFENRVLYSTNNPMYYSMNNREVIGEFLNYLDRLDLDEMYSIPEYVRTICDEYKAMR